MQGKSDLKLTKQTKNFPDPLKTQPTLSKLFFLGFMKGELFDSLE